MNRTEQRMMGIALTTAADSDYERVRIGAVIARKDRLISVGFNKKRSHPEQAKYNALAGRNAPKHSCHAEMAALIKAGCNDLTGTTVYVGRYDNMGRLAMCRPCAACRLALVRRGVSDVVYTSESGVVHEQANQDEA